MMEAHLAAGERTTAIHEHVSLHFTAMTMPIDAMSGSTPHETPARHPADGAPLHDRFSVTDGRHNIAISGAVGLENLEQGLSHHAGSSRTICQSLLLDHDAVNSETGPKPPDDGQQRNISSNSVISTGSTSC